MPIIMDENGKAVLLNDKVLKVQDGGTTIIVGGSEKDKIEFDSDPQTQINTIKHLIDGTNTIEIKNDGIYIKG